MRTNAEGPPPDTSEVATSLTLRQAAIYLGVHDETIRRWIKDGRLPAVKVGIAGHYRVRRDDLDSMVTAA
jgi:excisionase family DNA binding protein